jgi:trehalose/maltose hydrolase-like predicted phosphorylase/beta-phosphoglucomutase-like phosphatase (HAD superfamily)
MTVPGRHHRPADAVVYDGYEIADEGLRETLTSTGNGYFCTRGCAEWEDADGVHYPGTYAHCVYNRETTILAGRPVANEDMVNLPNWLVLKLRINGEEPINLVNVDLRSYRHSFDLGSAELIRELRFADRSGRLVSLKSRRFVSMDRMHQAGIRWELTAENWSGRIEIISALDGRVLNLGVERYRQLEGRHLDPQGPRIFGPDVIALKTRTRQSRIEIAQAARTRAYRGDEEIPAERSTYQMEDYIHQVLAFDVHQGETIVVEKMAALYTSRDRAINEPLSNAGKSAERYPRYEHAFSGHQRAWDELWEVCDVELPNELRVQFLLRLHISHVLQVCSRMSVHHDAGVPARGLNGEAYRGHVFWDELYVYPFLNFRLPEITRSLLMYRYRRIGEARAAAAEAGYQGAMYPWQSGSDGEEETQVVHLNPLSGRWEPDHSHNQRHVNAAIFYNVWHYYQATHDLEFLRDHGAEMMLEIARFWASIAHFNADRDRWEIHGVMGPDEFHEKYPDSEEGGLRNNAYTNVMVAWICETAQKVLDLLPATRSEALRAKIGLTDGEIEQWRDMSRRMFVPFHGDGIISQFEGYEDLRELDWDAYRAKYGNIQRLDRILRAEGDSPDHYKLAKQADTVLLFFLFSESELRGLFERLGYEYASDAARKNIEYYDHRTSHGSTLSFVAHAGILAGIDPESSWERFLVALESDIGDIQGGTTREGIHVGVMSGTMDLMQRAYLGTSIRDDVLHLDPTVPDKLDGLSLRMQFRGTPIHVTLSGRDLTVEVDPEGLSPSLRVGVAGVVRELEPGDSCTFSLDGSGGANGDGPVGRGRFRRRRRAGYAGVIFDVDGLLVDSPHEAAWRETLRELMEGDWSDLRERTTYSPEAFTWQVYQEEVAGMPRMAGAIAALKYFNVPDAEERAVEYAARKQAKVVALIKAGRYNAYEDAIRFLLAVKRAGIPVAAASSSKNAGLLLGGIRLDSYAAEHGLDGGGLLYEGETLQEILDADCSGRDYARGKPDPEIFVTAAAELGAPPEQCLVVEDAASGVAAAKAGGMAAIGVARADDAELLRAADLVVTTLDDVDTDKLLKGELALRTPSSA